MARTKLSDQVRKSARRSVKEEPEKSNGFLSTGSTLLNLCLSDRTNGGFPKGKVVNIIGDSHTGKTILALTLEAEAAYREDLADYRLLYDDAESANAFNMEYLFGAETAERIEPPAYDEDGEPLPSETVEHLQANVQNAIGVGKPFIYILDSLDAISSMDEMKRMEEDAALIAAGKPAKGSFKMEKAKKMSELFRTLTKRIAKTDSLLVIVSQTRDNIDPFSFAKKTRSGGKALEFYCSHVIWLASKGPLKARDLIIGAKTIAKVSKNKSTGKRRDCEFSIYYDYGIDDIGSMIDYLITQKVWSKPAKSPTVTCPGFGDKMSKAKLVEHIEDNGLERKLRRMVGKQWKAVEDSLKLGRKRRYG